MLFPGGVGGGGVSCKAALQALRRILQGPADSPDLLRLDSFELHWQGLLYDQCAGGQWEGGGGERGMMLLGVVKAE